MKVLKGTSIASGIARGMVCLYTGAVEETIPHYSIEPDGVPRETERLMSALERARGEMRRMIATAEAGGDRKAVEIFTAHLMILSDEVLARQVTGLVKERLINAEHAVSDVFEEYIRTYEKEQGHFRELTHDFIDTRDRILAAFSSAETGAFKCEVGEERPIIIAAKRLTPSMVLNVPKGHALAFVTEEGGFTSHATILARSFGVPIVFGVKVDEELACGDEAVVDGSAGKVTVAPDEAMKRYYDKKIEAIEKRRRVCEVYREAAPRTGDNVRVALKVNISTPEEVALIKDMPHDGIGLLRTEFLFMRRDAPPGEEEQYRMYREVLGKDPARPVTVRLLDIGGDKLPLFLKLPAGSNPDLELRGAMAVEVFPDIYEAQLKALLRANDHGNLRLLYPMVSDPGDLATFRAALAKARKALRKEKVAVSDARIPEGVMVETPAAVMMADEILAEVDFINIGSNDLLQYTLAAARGNTLAEKRYHILHPSLVKLLSLAARAGRKAGKEVCLCGEIASFEEYYPLFLQAGLASFSVAVAKFNDIRCALLHVKRGKGTGLVEKYLRTKTKDEADRFFSRFV